MDPLAASAWVFISLRNSVGRCSVDLLPPTTRVRLVWNCRRTIERQERTRFCDLAGFRLSVDQHYQYLLLGHLHERSQHLLVRLKKTAPILESRRDQPTP